MSVLMTTLRKLLELADEHFHAGRLPAARRGYEELLERSQERTDRAMEVCARCMLARCHLRRKDLDGVREELSEVARIIDPEHIESHARYRAVLARLAMADGRPDATRAELYDYLRWAEERESHVEVVDACLLLAAVGVGSERLEWIQRAIDSALDRSVEEPLGGAYTALASALDLEARRDEALEAYQQALFWSRRTGDRRRVVGSSWAVGAAACRAEDWPLARSILEEAIREGERSSDCVDLVALALADLAQVNEASGDVIEARRLVLRSVQLAREQDLARLWPERWGALLTYARSLELDVY